MQKIVVVGSCGSGKTFFGKALSKKLEITCVDLDDLFWLPKWTPRPFVEFSQKVAEVASWPSWIICGNQSKVRALFWSQADTIIWLDLPFYILLFRIVKRSLQQRKNQELICNGNQQTFKQFLWLLYWLCSSYFRRKKTYKILKKQHAHQWIHLKTTKEVDSFLKNLSGKNDRF